VNRLSPVAGRRQRRYWIGHGRAHIEVRDVHRLENVDLARRMEDELARLNGVDWARSTSSWAAWWSAVEVHLLWQ
jgi:hypothetical protein